MACWHGYWRRTALLGQLGVQERKCCVLARSISLLFKTEHRTHGVVRIACLLGCKSCGLAVERAQPNECTTAVGAGNPLYNTSCAWRFLCEEGASPRGRGARPLRERWGSHGRRQVGTGPLTESCSSFASPQVPWMLSGLLPLGCAGLWLLGVQARPMLAFLWSGRCSCLFPCKPRPATHT